MGDRDSPPLLVWPFKLIPKTLSNIAHHWTCRIERLTLVGGAILFNIFTKIDLYPHCAWGGSRPPAMWPLIREIIAPSEHAAKVSQLAKNCVSLDGGEPQVAVKTFSHGRGGALPDSQCVGCRILSLGRSYVSRILMVHREGKRCHGVLVVTPMTNNDVFFVLNSAVKSQWSPNAGVHSNQGLILWVKTRVYVGFWVHRGSWLLWLRWLRNP